MGISDAIARVRQGVKKGGLPAVMAELGEQLRSDSIPPSLRPAASRLATLLRVPSAPAVPRDVVSLTDTYAPHAVDSTMSASECPFPHDAIAAAAVHESVLETSVTAEALAEPAIAETIVAVEIESKLESEARAAEASEAAVSAARDRGDEPTVVATPRRRSVPAPKVAREPAPAKKKAAAPAPRSKSAAPAAKPSKAAPEKATTKDKEKVAAKAAPANSSARSNAKAASKRPSAKATSKKK